MELNYSPKLTEDQQDTIFLFLENGQMYIQKKPTMYPPWDSTFDAHINKGRVMQIIVKGKNVDLISETTVELYSLAERCRKNNGRTEIWVNIRAVNCRKSVSFWSSSLHLPSAGFTGVCYHTQLVCTMMLASC